MSPSDRHCESFAVIDSFLPDETFQTVSTYVHQLEYRQTSPGMSIWHAIENENPRQSIQTYAWASSRIAERLTDPIRAELRSSASMLIHPSGTPVDLVLEAVREEAGRASALVGKEGSDWVGILSSAFAYPPGARAAWHTDDHEYRGAFIYYVHDRWEKDWGGELLLEDQLLGVGDGHYVAPLPNRLVILKGGIPHSVTRVSARTGGLARTSLSGFFVVQAFSNTLLAALPTTEPKGTSTDASI